MAVTANQLLKCRNPRSRVSIPVAASTRIYQGTIVYLAAGYAAADDNAGANVFAGIAIEEIDNSAGSAGDKRVEVYRLGEFELVGTGFTQATVGALVYGSDNFTIQTNPTGVSLVGRVSEFLSSTKVMVDIDAIQT